MVAKPKTDFELAAETLTGDTRDALLSHIKAMETPWSKLPEGEQRDRVALATKLADHLVREAVRIVAANGLPHMVISVGKFTCDGAEMKGTYTAFASDDNLLRARHLSEQRAVFVLASEDAFVGSRQDPEVDRDEPELGVEEAA